MKNPKAPTRKQKDILRSHGLNVDNFLIVKNLPGSLEVVKRTDLKKYRGDNEKIRTRKLMAGDGTGGMDGKGRNG